VEAPFLEASVAGHVNDLSTGEWAAPREQLGRPRMLGMSLDAGGDLTHGFRPNISGKMVDQASYGVDPDTGLLDYDTVAKLASQLRPVILVAATRPIRAAWTLPGWPRSPMTWAPRSWWIWPTLRAWWPEGSSPASSIRCLTPTW
jgi:hypothetical protein